MYIHAELRGFLPADLEDPFLNLLSLSRQYLYLWNPKKHHKHLEPSVRLTWTPATRSSQRLSKYPRYTRESPSQRDRAPEVKDKGQCFRRDCLHDAIPSATLWPAWLCSNAIHEVQTYLDDLDASRETPQTISATHATSPKLQRKDSGGHALSGGARDPTINRKASATRSDSSWSTLGAWSVKAQLQNCCFALYNLYIRFICHWLLLHICCEWDARWCK